MSGCVYHGSLRGQRPVSSLFPQWLSGTELRPSNRITSTFYPVSLSTSPTTQPELLTMASLLIQCICSQYVVKCNRVTSTHTHTPTHPHAFLPPIPSPPPQLPLWRSCLTKLFKRIESVNKYFSNPFFWMQRIFKLKIDGRSHKQEGHSIFILKLETRISKIL